MQKLYHFLILCTLTSVNLIKAGQYLYCKNPYSCKINFSIIAYEYDKINFPDEKPKFKYYKITE